MNAAECERFTGRSLPYTVADEKRFRRYMAQFEVKPKAPPVNVLYEEAIAYEAYKKARNG